MTSSCIHFLVKLLKASFSAGMSDTRQSAELQILLFTITWAQRRYEAGVFIE